MTHHLVMPHLHGNRIFLYGKHTAETATFVFTFRFHNFHSFYQREQITQFAEIRNIKFAGRRKFHQSHSMTTVLQTHFMWKLGFQRRRSDDIMNKLTDIIYLTFAGAPMFVFFQQTTVVITHKNDATGRRAHYIIVILKLFVKMAG